MIFRILLVFAALSLAVPALAQENALYTVSGLHVDATAASSSEAEDAAVAQGRARAFQILYRRLTRQADWARQPVLDAPSLLRLSRGTTMVNERRSTTRYVADVTYAFNPGAVARLLRAAQIAFSQAPARPILLIPMSPGVDHGPWSQALMAPGLRDSQVPFTVLAPEDDAGLAALDFDGATWNDVAPVAIKNHVEEVGLVQVVPSSEKMTVNIRILAPGESPTKTSLDVPMLQTVGSTYPQAAQAAAYALEDIWKAHSVIDFSQRGRLIADVRIGSLAQWGEIQSSLAAVNNVTAVNVTAMDMSYARINLTYQGDLEQLREAMGAAGLSLTNRGGQWTLAKPQ